MARILIVVNDETKLERLGELLRGDGHSVSEATGEREAIAAIEVSSFDLVITRQRLADGQGLDVLSACQDANPMMPVVIATEIATLELAVEALRRGAFDLLTMPLTPQGVRAVVNRALERIGLKRENQVLRGETTRLGFASEMLGEGAALLEVKQKIALVAPTNATVLIHGETGTGKELAARAVHGASPRANAAFLAVNCAAFPDSLLDSELFGHEKGAFTGADRTRPGWFEAADGGTLFLDEAGEMSLPLQAKLLRVLTDRQIVRVGSRSARSIDVRLILATHLDLKALVGSGAFREDLYYRVAVVPIEMPPLRSRPEDIPPLVERFLTQTAQDLKVPRRKLSPEAMKKLCGYEFPGNIRELRNLIERACILSRSQTIGPADFPLGSESQTAADADPVSTCVSALPGTLDLRETLDQFEKALLIRALADAEGVQAEAARRLTLARGDIGYKMKKYGISQPEARSSEDSHDAGSTV